MTDVQLKYDMLDPFSQKKVDALIESLLDKKGDDQSNNEHLLKVSVWTEDDLKVFDENAKLFNNWKIEEW